MIGLSKRGVQICLGLLWILDGLLQLQPRMFSSKFSSDVLASAAEGQPSFVRAPIHLGMHIFLSSPVVFNSLFVITQITIGALILYKRTTLWGLRLSIAWGVIVWIFGEGYGGIFSAHTLLLYGAPGAAILYVLISAAVLQDKNDINSNRVSTAYWLILAWAIIWVGGGIYQLLPGQNKTTDISNMLHMNAQDSPAWLSSLDNSSANFLQERGSTSDTTPAIPKTRSAMSNMSSPSPNRYSPGYLFIILLASIQIFIGTGALLFGFWHKIAIYFGMLFSFIFWVVGQNVGQLYSGLATDPNSGPLLILMGLAILGLRTNKNLLPLGKKVEKLMIGAKFTEGGH